MLGYGEVRKLNSEPAHDGMNLLVFSHSRSLCLAWRSVIERKLHLLFLPAWRMHEEAQAEGSLIYIDIYTTLAH